MLTRNIGWKRNIPKTVKILHKLQCNLSEFVPKHDPVNKEDVVRLQNFIVNGQRIFVITGAGISTESGIPDYRSEGVGLYDRSNHKPVQFQEFIRDPNIRRRYWARNYIGWPKFSKIRPNKSHKILAEWEKKGKVGWIVTQNVDRLHQKAGSKNVTELHGCGYNVKCINSIKGECNYSVDRHVFQEMLDWLNHELMTELRTESKVIRPDGDIDLDSELIANFEIPTCPKCDAFLKPDIIFFGDNVPGERVNFVFSQMRDCDSILVIGSSLFVYSGYRLVLAAKEEGKNIALINIGKSRADSIPQLVRFHRRAGEFLPLIII